MKARKRNYKRKVTTKSVKAIVKRAIAKNIETKQLRLKVDNFGCTPNTIHTWNLMDETQGDTQFTFTGEQFEIKGFSLNFIYRFISRNSVGTYVTPQVPIYLNFGVIMVNTYTLSLNLTKNDILQTTEKQQLATCHTIDPDKARWLVKRKIKITPESTANVVDQFRHGKMYKKYSKQVRFADYGLSGVTRKLSGWNYYIIAWADSPGYDSNFIEIGNLNFDSTVYIKDA